MEINVVVRSAPFQRTIIPLAKLVPLTVSVKPAPPAVADAGLRLVMVGAGTPLIVKFRELEVPPPGDGLNTVTGAIPAAAMSEAGMAAVSRVEETNVVVRFDPFQRTTDPVTKLVPLTVSVKVPPVALPTVTL